MKGRLLTAQDEVSMVAARIDRYALAEDAVAIDTETTGFDTWRHDVIRGLSVAYRNDVGELESYYVPISHPDSANLNPEPIVDALKRTPAKHVGHNISFDWSSLEQIGFEPRMGDGTYFDTGTMAWLWNENQNHELKQQGAYHFGEDADAEQRALKAIMAGQKQKHYMELVRPGIRKGKLRIAQQWARERAAASKKSWRTLTAEDIGEYAAQDTDLTLRLYELQLEHDYAPTDPWPDVEREFRVREAAYRLVKAGVRVHTSKVESLRAEYAKARDEIASEFDINLGSTKQLRGLLYDEWKLPILAHTPGGEPATDRDTLEQLEGLHAGLDRILEYRRLDKMIGTYLDNFLSMADDNDRIHTSLNPTGTVTGRFSSSKPNMQNLPTDAKDSTIKHLFRARDGYELIEVDIKSAELFVGAAIAHDDDLLSALMTPGRDFHTETAERIFGNADGGNRRLAKNLNYGLPYGLGAKGFAVYMMKGTGKPVTNAVISEAAGIVEGWKKAWPITGRTIRQLTNFAERNGYIPLTQPGRFRHFSAPGFTVPAYTAFNAVVQGGVAEVVKSWMLALEPLLDMIGALIVLQVHDSLWIEVPKGMVDEAVRLAQSALTLVNPYYVPLSIDSKRLDVAKEG